MRRSSCSKARVAIRSWRCADTTDGVGEPGFVRRAGLWRVVFELVAGFDFMGSLPCHPSRIRSVTKRIGGPLGGVKALRRVWDNESDLAYCPLSIKAYRVFIDVQEQMM
jgi:hypothetical protein